MQQDILINWSPQETRVAVVEHGALQEMHIERPLQRGIVGNIYLGKVMPTVLYWIVHTVLSVIG